MRTLSSRSDVREHKPIRPGFRRAVRLGLERLGWLGPFYRARERQIARDATDWPREDDGLPLPSAHMAAVVAGHADVTLFLRQGAEIAAFIKDLAVRHGGSAEAGDVLDFGCGCGRLARRLVPKVTAAGGGYTGVDINAELVAWCASALPGRYLRNALRPPSPLPDAAFDLLFSVSVFTHLPRERMQAWLGDFRRVLRPGGLALVSFADETRVALADCERPDRPLGAELARSGFATSTRALEGSNFMSSYATVDAFRTLAADMFEVLEVAPSAHTGQTLAWAVLRRRAAV